MDIFAQRRLAVVLIVVLVILNVGTMSLLWVHQMRKPGPPPRPERAPHDRAGSPSLLRQELGLNAQQFERYMALRDQQREAARGIIDEVHALKKQMFNEVFEGEPDTAEVERMLQLIAEKQTALERLTFAHLTDLKELCGQGQQEKLQILLDEFYRTTGNPQHIPVPRPPAPE